MFYTLGRGEKRDLILDNLALSQDGLTLASTPLQTDGMCRKDIPKLGTCRHTELVGGQCFYRLICRDQSEKRIEEFIMDKRFMLTAAGAAATGIAGSASAVLVDFNHGLDRWAGEHSFQVYSSAGSVVASMSGMAYYGVVSGTFGYSTNSAATSHWGNVWGQYDLASGTYNVQMQDSYGDGWSWGSYQGGLTIGSGSGTVTGSSASFSFTVVPAPGALALLGLAGIAGTRRRK